MPIRGGAAYCEWQLAYDTTRTLLTVMAVVAPPMTFEEYVAQDRALLAEAFNQADYERVAGVGDAAVWAHQSTFQTWGRNRMVQIQSGVGGEALDREKSAELARRALERL